MHEPFRTRGGNKEPCAFPPLGNIQICPFKLLQKPAQFRMDSRKHINPREVPPPHRATLVRSLWCSALAFFLLRLPRTAVEVVFSWLLGIVVLACATSKLACLFRLKDFVARRGLAAVCALSKCIAAESTVTLSAGSRKDPKDPKRNHTEPHKRASRSVQL